MEMVLGEKFTQSFPVVLLSGEWLCALANKLFQALGMKDKRCDSTPTTWPAAMAGDVADAAEAWTTRDSSGGEVWMQQKQLARQNVDAYLRACAVIGVVAQDCFQPDDLLELRDLDKVYRNILALQNVAVTISHRRSIDDRSSVSTSYKPSIAASPAPSLLRASDSVGSPRSSRSTSYREEGMSWRKLLARYESQQLTKSITDEQSGNPSASDGLGKLAHDIWCTEELIRALLLREDGHAELVPNDLHGKLWLLASGAAVEMRRHKGQYRRYVSMESESTEATRQIDADLHRTVPDTDKPFWSEEKTMMMRRVLVAYSFHNPALGYCQGLNYIVARLLQFVEEEEAFFILTKLIKLVPDDYYSTMLGLAVDQHVFADFVRLQNPDVVEHLTQLGGSGMELSLACTEWFLTLFASPCNREVTVRIWDAIFLMGDELLFRVALALMQTEKDALLKTNSYGDMLKHLNELGRGDTDMVRLMRDAQLQDCVGRARIEDFRAHHRLQLAAGIAVSAMEAEDSGCSAAGTSTDGGKEDVKMRLFGGRKRSGLFRQQDKNAGRLHRTFDRILTEEYTVMLQKEQPTFSCYYDGRPPLVFDMYWGSARSYNQWGKRNYRRITETGVAVKEAKEERRRLQSDGSGLSMSSSLRVPDEYGARSLPTKGRERRSRSTAFIQPKKTGQSAHHDLQQTRKPDEDLAQLSRSPKGWFQRIEGWHKDLKIQKEKKKAEKLKQKKEQAEQEAGASRGISRDRTFNKTFAGSPPKWRHIDETDSTRGNSFDSHSIGMTTRTGRPNKRSESLDVHVSRSYSDPFMSPNTAHVRSWQDSSHDAFGQTTHRSPPFAKGVEKSEADADVSALYFTEQSQMKSEDQRDRQYGAPHPFPSGATSASADPSAVHSFSVPVMTTFEMEDVDVDNTDGSGRLSFDMGTFAPVGEGELASPIMIRRASTNGYQDERLDANLVRLHPHIRRNISLPIAQQGSAEGRRKPPPDAARLLRERAQVLSYMQRKASDASSITSSIPRTPRERCDTLKSDSSSDSVRTTEFLLPTNRSAKSATGATTSVRKSSFSFFDKLSLETESHLGDLGHSFVEDDDIPDRLDRAIFGDWSPTPSHESKKTFSASASSTATRSHAAAPSYNSSMFH
ncbi:hypothetical protein PINS_up002857 [Pythium insidiosum]|nr:hypothetical protein PINS_up002857 [Pythium insidiosum]